MNRRNSIMRILLLTLLLGGCSVKETVSSQRVVTEITVTCQQDGTLSRKIYNDANKMRQILNALRQVGQRFDPDIDPEELPLRSYCILLTHSDGTQRIWRTKGDRYIRQCRGPWQQADPKRISQLELILQSLPSDVPQIGPREDLPRDLSSG